MWRLGEWSMSIIMKNAYFWIIPHYFLTIKQQAMHLRLLFSIGVFQAHISKLKMPKWTWNNVLNV